MASPSATKRSAQPVPAGSFRIGWISLLAALVGILAGLIAYLLYDLIALFTNLTFYHVVSLHFRSPEHTTIGPWVILMPVIGGVYGNKAGSVNYGSNLYAHTDALYDVTSGSNGTCKAGKNGQKTYFCTAGVGYDGPTGLGTPNGTAAFGD